MAYKCTEEWKVIWRRDVAAAGTTGSAPEGTLSPSTNAESSVSHRRGADCPSLSASGERGDSLPPGALGVGHFPLGLSTGCLLAHLPVPVSDLWGHEQHVSSSSPKDLSDPASP